jgi:hypothetical protein
MLFAAREGDVRVFEAAELPSLWLAGLDADAAGLLLGSGKGVAASPAVRDRLVRLTGGSALALLEIPPALTDESPRCSCPAGPQAVVERPLRPVISPMRSVAACRTVEAR